MVATSCAARGRSAVAVSEISEAHQKVRQQKRLIADLLDEIDELRNQLDEARRSLSEADERLMMR